MKSIKLFVVFLLLSVFLIKLLFPFYFEHFLDAIPAWKGTPTVTQMHWGDQLQQYYLSWVQHQNIRHGQSIFKDPYLFATKDHVFVDMEITPLYFITALLGFISTATENHVVCRNFLSNLRDRGLRTENEILFVIDGGKGLYKGVKEVLGDKALIQRCQWHKRENVVSYLGETKKAYFRRKLQSAYEQPTYESAKKALGGVKRELALVNAHAVKSLEEGFEDTLTLHRLGLFPSLGESFKTTNCIENINKLLSGYTGRVNRWQNSQQRQRWVATALLEIEPNLRKVRGFEYLKDLRVAMRSIATPFESKYATAA